MKKELTEFIYSIDNNLFNKIRGSQSDAECRKYLLEHLENQQPKNLIPKSFKLFNSTINVVFDNKRMDDIDAFGYYEYSAQKITLATKDRVDDISDDRIIETFYHERTHAILFALKYDELNKDEQFVDLFSKALRQADETAEY